jgi:hypothetical protein
MAKFIDHTGAQALVELTPSIYREASEANLTLKAFINRKYQGDAKVGTAYDQFKASLGLIVPKGKDFGLRAPTVADVLEGRTIQAGAVVQGNGTGFGNESRTLFPSVVIDMIEAYMEKDRDMDKGIMSQLIAYDQAISGTNFEQPVINYTDVTPGGPETARAQRIAQLAEPAALVRFTTSDKLRRIPTFSIGAEFSQQALKATTLDLVGLTMGRFLACEEDARVYEAMADMINGDLDINTNAISTATTTSYDAAATGGVVTHRSWVKWLRQSPKVLKISHVICDIDTYLKVEARTGRPGTVAYDPRLAVLDPQTSLINPVVGEDVRFWIVDSAANGGPVAANTLVGIDARYAIARVRNLDAEYTASEVFAMKRSEALRIDSGMIMYRLQNQAWSAMTIA